MLGPVTPQQIKAVNSRANALPFTTIAVEAPSGATYEIGDSLLVLQVGGELDPYGNIVVPTGLARSSNVDGHYVANIVATYGPIRNGQRVLPSRASIRARRPGRPGVPMESAGRSSAAWGART